MTKNSSALRSVTQPCAPTVWLSAPSLWVNTCLKGIAPFSLLCSFHGPLSPDHFALMTFTDVLRPPRECFSLRLLPPMFTAMLTRIALRLACRNRRIQIKAHAKLSLSKCLEESQPGHSILNSHKCNHRRLWVYWNDANTPPDTDTHTHTHIIYIYIGLPVCSNYTFFQFDWWGLLDLAQI